MRNNYLKLFLAACSLLLATFFISEFAAAEDVLYYQCDAQGTPVAMTDAQGNVVWQGGCSPFGEDFKGTGTREPRMGYCGKLYDHQLGLYDFGARYYDPAKGRFTGVDPVTGDISDSQRLNSYAYCLNNPYKYVDPDGQNATLTIGVAIVVISTLYISGAISVHRGEVPDLSFANPFEKHVPYEEQKTQSGTTAAGAPNPPGKQPGKNEKDKAGQGKKTERNTNQDKKLTEGEIKKLKDAGYDPEQLKKDFFGERTGKTDLFKSQNGDVYVKPKGGSGPGEPTNINLKGL